MLEKVLNGFQKPSNWALDIGKNTSAPMEGTFRGVRPYKDASSKYGFMNKSALKITALMSPCLRDTFLSNCLKIMQNHVFKVKKNW